MTDEILQSRTMGVDGFLGIGAIQDQCDNCDNYVFDNILNTIFIKLRILVLVQLLNWSIAIVISITCVRICAHVYLVFFMFVFFVTPQVSFSAKYFSTCCAAFVFMTGSVFI